MKTIKVIAAGYSAAGKDMGDLVNEGILKKDYNRLGDLTWTNISDDVIVKNEYETLLPGESVTWEK
jgi:hypothetical protein